MKILTKHEENEIFKEACDGFGFEELEQTVDGTFCNGCNIVHKRPIRMYHNCQNGNARQVLCKYYVVAWYNPNQL